MGHDTARAFGPGKPVADASQELRKPVEFMTYTVISAQAFEFHNRNYLSSALSLKFFVPARPHEHCGMRASKSVLLQQRCATHALQSAQLGRNDW
jgi:hypothetical protein